LGNEFHFILDGKKNFQENQNGNLVSEEVAVSGVKTVKKSSAPGVAAYCRARVSKLLLTDVFSRE
jgi:hypothetical protein